MTHDECVLLFKPNSQTVLDVVMPSEVTDVLSAAICSHDILITPVIFSW